MIQGPSSNLTGKLEKKLGHAFAEKAHLELALTHRSYSQRNYERLEFLGDAALNFVIAAELFRRFDGANEGELSRLRARLVKQSALAELAREMDIGSFLTMGGGELKSGGFDRDSILSDALEAIVGAILLDAGFLQAEAAIRRWFESRLDSLSLDDIRIDPKSRLQEHLQSLGEPLPEYALVRSWGKSPRQQFEVVCRVGGLTEPATASGPSKRQAEQEAAEKVLDALGVPR